MVVRRDSCASSLDDLRGASWAYNESDSHSGYHVVRWFLAQRNRDGRCFGRVVSSGAHETLLDKIVAGDVDASAVDSTVLEMWVNRTPARRALAGLDIDERGRAILRAGRLARFAVVRDADYDCIREMLRQAVESLTGRSRLRPGPAGRQVSGRSRLGAGAGGDLGVDESEAY